MVRITRRVNQRMFDRVRAVVFHALRTALHAVKRKTSAYNATQDTRERRRRVVRSATKLFRTVRRVLETIILVLCVNLDTRRGVPVNANLAVKCFHIVPNLIQLDMNVLNDTLGMEVTANYALKRSLTALFVIGRPLNVLTAKKGIH